MSHLCPECGAEHETPAPPVAEEAAVVEVERTAEADVEIAQIEAERDVAVEKIRAGVDEAALESRVGSLEGELRGMREVLDRLAPPEPESDPEPVLVPAPEPVQPELPLDLPRAEKPEPVSRKKSSNIFGF